MRTNFDSGRHT